MVSWCAAIVRHALLLVSLYRLQGSIPAYLLLTAFDLSLSLIAIVATTRDTRDPTSVDPRSRWLAMRALAILVLAGFFAVTAAILTVPIGMPALIIGMAENTDWWARCRNAASGCRPGLGAANTADVVAVLRDRRLALPFRPPAGDAETALTLQANV